MIDRGHTGAIRFVGGHQGERPFDRECRLVSRLPDRIELTTVDEPLIRIDLRARSVGKAIAATESDSTSSICTYETDTNDAGMAKWIEDRDGNIEVRAGDY